MGKGKKRAPDRPRDKFGRFVKTTLFENHENNPLQTPVQAAPRTPQLELSTNPGEPSSFPQGSFRIEDTAVRVRNRSRLFGQEENSERILSEYEQEPSSSSFDFSPESQRSPIAQPPAAVVRGSTKINQPALPYHWHPEFPHHSDPGTPFAPQGLSTPPKPSEAPHEPSEAPQEPSEATTAPPVENGRRGSPPIQTPVPSPLPSSAYRNMEEGQSSSAARASPAGPAMSPQDARRNDDWVPAYSQADRLFDAAVIYAVEQAIGIGLLQQLRPAMSVRVSQQVRTLMSQFSEKERHERVAQANAGLSSPMSAASSLDSFIFMIARFMSGPNTRSPERSREGTRQPSSPVRSNDRIRQNRREPYRRDRADSGSRTEDDSDYLRRHRRQSTAGPREASRPSSHRGEPRVSTERASTASRNMSLRLKPEMFKFDGKSVDAYISRIHHLARSCGDDAVLANLSVGIISDHDSDGARWFLSLTEKERTKLTNNLKLWDDKLRQRFRSDRGDIMKKADRMTHSFEKENELSLRQYIDEKIYLYNEAGDVDEDAQVRRIHAGLDPDLQAAIALDSTDNTLEKFKDLISRNEYNVRQKWQKAHEERDAQQRQIRELQNQLDIMKKTSGNRIDKPARFDRYQQRYDDGNKNYPNFFQPPRSPNRGYDGRDRERGTEQFYRPRTPADNAPDNKDKGGGAPKDKDKFDGPNRSRRERFQRTGSGNKPGVQVYVTFPNQDEEEISAETVDEIRAYHHVDEDSAESDGVPLDDEEEPVKTEK